MNKSKNITNSIYIIYISIDYSKVNPLVVTYLDKNTLKLDAEYVVLLKLKRLRKLRYTRHKVLIGEYSLIFLPLKDA